MTPKEARLQHITHYRELIDYYTESIEDYTEWLKDDNLSETRRKCYEGLIAVCKKELADCRKELLSLLNFKG